MSSYNGYAYVKQVKDLRFRQKLFLYSMPMFATYGQDRGKHWTNFNTLTGIRGVGGLITNDFQKAIYMKSHMLPCCIY